jgi:hypothetical protein
MAAPERLGMPRTSTLEGCSRRYAHQIQKLGAFMALIREPLNTADRAVVQTAREIVIVSVTAHLDEFLNLAVGTAAVHRADDVKAFLAAHGNPEEKKDVNTCNEAALMRMMRRRVSFKEKAKKLVRISQLLFDAEPWPDANTGRFTRDLVLVRNIIVHAGGWPDHDHAKIIETPGVIVGVPGSWKLEINDVFIGEVLAAAGLVGLHLNTVFANHPKFRL